MKEWMDVLDTKILHTELKGADAQGKLLKMTNRE